MIAVVLARNEFIKTVRRFAFWAAFLGFGGLIAFVTVDLQLRALHDPRVPRLTLPGGWADVVEPGVFGALFSSVVLILLVAGEFSWRTARQSVIDGLSKAQWFGGKLLLLVAVCLSFLALQVGIIGGIALYGTDLGATTAPLLRGSDAAMLGGYALALVGFGSLALLLASTIRSPGPAMAVFFFVYVAFKERVLGSLFARVSETAAAWAPYLPDTIFHELMKPARYDAAALAAATARAAVRGQEFVLAPSTGAVVGLAAGYIVLFLTVSFVSLLRRDL